MAISDKSISGKVGNTVFYRVGRSTRIRSTSSEYTDAKTPEQIVCRAQFMVAIHFYRNMVSTPLREVWRAAAHGTNINGYNLFLRLNMKVFKPNGKISDFSRFLPAVGMMQRVSNLRGSVDDEDAVTLTWEYDEGLPPARMQDQLMVVALYGNRSFSPVFVEVQATRSDKKATFRLNRRRGTAAHLYVFFREENGKDYSTCQYLRF